MTCPGLGFLLHPGFPGDRQAVKGNVAEVDMGIGFARMIGDDRDRRHPELAATPAVEEIDQTMVETRDHENDPLQPVGGTHRPCHREIGGDRLEGVTQALEVRIGRGSVERHPHEEVAGFDIVELLGVENVEPAAEQGGGDFRDDAGPVDAREREDVASGRHATGFSNTAGPRPDAKRLGRQARVRPQAPGGVSPPVRSAIRSNCRAL